MASRQPHSPATNHHNLKGFKPPRKGLNRLHLKGSPEIGNPSCSCTGPIESARQQGPPQTLRTRSTNPKFQAQKNHALRIRNSYDPQFKAAIELTASI